MVIGVSADVAAIFEFRWGGLLPAQATLTITGSPDTFRTTDTPTPTEVLDVAALVGSTRYEVTGYGPVSTLISPLTLGEFALRSQGVDDPPPCPQRDGNRWIVFFGHQRKIAIPA